ncbi:YbjN domain-containing protein [Cupriavidus sp. amp6]|uniref:YbjN domain-containing protein n=1 Tax=Cupriavidus sp. amp6 TaxID=388051 RepID=UPI0003F5A4E4|nr:YbjN domain-containing protein [Cupriavidus sp. amp6]
MTKTFTEAEITIAALEAHILDSGLVPYKVQPDGIWLRTENGISYGISLIPDRKFIRIGTYLPLTQQASIDQKRELARRLNEEVFLPVFTVDQDEDLTVAYALPFTHGLIAGNFISVVNRFGSLLEYVVQNFNEGGLIHFGNPSEASGTPASGELLH